MDDRAGRASGRVAEHPGEDDAVAKREQSVDHEEEGVEGEGGGVGVATAHCLVALT